MLVSGAVLCLHVASTQAGVGFRFSTLSSGSVDVKNGVRFRCSTSCAYDVLSEWRQPQLHHPAYMLLDSLCLAHHGLVIRDALPTARGLYTAIRE